MREVLDDLGITAVQGVLLDLGLSSDQLAWTHRGFSFAADGPLDMRFDPEPGRLPISRPTAAELLSTLSEKELAQVFFDYGEERFSRRIARRIVETAPTSRPIRPPGSLPSWSARAFPDASGTGRSTRRPASSRPCGSWSTTSSATSTRSCRKLPEILAPGAGLRSSASTRWKTAASSGPFATTRSSPS